MTTSESSMNVKQQAAEVMKGLLVQPGGAGGEGWRMVYRWRCGLVGFRAVLGEWLLMALGAAFFLLPLLNLPGREQISLSGWLVTVPFMLLGIVLIYRWLALMINRTTFDITNQRLSARHAPLPMPGAQKLDLPLAQVVSVEWKKRVSTSRGGVGRTMVNLTYSYDLVVIDSASQMTVVLSGVANPQYVFAMASEINKGMEKP